MSDAKPCAETTPAAPRPAGDVAEARRLLAVLRAGGDQRRAKVDRVRQSVLDQSYENELKLTVAVDRVAGNLA